MGCCNGAGGSVAPMYIFAGARRKVEWTAGCIPGATVAMTDSSMIQGHLFLEWFKWFVGQLEGVPSLLLLDGHFAHLGTSVLKYARSANVAIFTLPSHCSHFLQPCDVGPFKAFKAMVEVAIHDFPLHHFGRLPTRDDIMSLTHVPWVRAFAASTVKSGLAKAGSCRCLLPRWSRALSVVVPRSWILLFTGVRFGISSLFCQRSETRGGGHVMASTRTPWALPTATLTK